MIKDSDIIRWVTYRGRKIPIKKGMEGKFKKKKDELSSEDEISKKEFEEASKIKDKLDRAIQMQVADDVGKELDDDDIRFRAEHYVRNNYNGNATDEEIYEKLKKEYKNRGWYKEDNDKRYNTKEEEYKLYKRAREKPDSIDPMTENSTDWEKLEKKYGKIYKERKNNFLEDDEVSKKFKERQELLNEKIGSTEGRDNLQKKADEAVKNEIFNNYIKDDKYYNKLNDEQKNIVKNAYFKGIDDYEKEVKNGERIGKQTVENFKEKQINDYSPKHLYDVGYEPEHEGLKYANKHNTFSNEKTMPDGNVIGANDKEGLKDIGGPTVSYTMSNERYYNLSNDERKAINKIISNNKEAERLEAQSTDIINNKSSRKDWKKHLGEAGEHTHETKDGKGYYDELSAKDKTRIINNDKRIEELKQDSINQAKILDNGPTHGKYSLDSDNDEKWSNYSIKESNSTKKERSSGVIVLDNGRVLLVENDDGSYGFPKGHAEKGETLRNTATRELLEETNYNAKIKDNFRVATKYTTESGRTKTDVYFVGEPDKNSKIIPREGEIKGAKFYTIDEAREKLNGYDNLINILDRATKSSSKKEEIPTVRKLRTLSDIEQYYLKQGYSKATALKMAKKEIRERKGK